MARTVGVTITLMLRSGILFWSGNNVYLIIFRMGIHVPSLLIEKGDISDVNLHDDEYMSEVLSHMLKRVSFRRQKRWWNAYMLLYRHADIESGVDISGLTRDMEGLSVDGHHEKEGVQYTPECPSL